MLRKSTGTIIFVLLTLGILAEACDPNHVVYGCRITNAVCGCGYGCPSEFRYKNMESCRLALKGGQYDICSNQGPCLHDGTCLQISQAPGFKCGCEGTGYYGTRCERPCPARNNHHFRGPFPYECVVI